VQVLRSRSELCSHRSDNSDPARNDGPDHPGLPARSPRQLMPFSPEQLKSVFRLAHGAAGGIEIDRYDLALGTPPHALVVASSGGHTDNYQTVVEEVLYPYPGLMGTYDYRIRADMVFFTSTNGGAVFSTGSIAFGQALPYANFENNISKLLANIVDAFAKPGALPGSMWTLEEKQWR
jgi:N,N-dimethylformamidase